MNNVKTQADKYFLLNVIYKKEDRQQVDSSESSINKANTDYLVQLIRTAMADNVITDSELEILYGISNRLGISEAETDQLIQITVKADYTPPSDLLSRFEQVFEIVNMILADGTIDQKEIHLASGFAAQCGFDEGEILGLLVLLSNGIEQGKHKAELFKEYKSKVKSI